LFTLDRLLEIELAQIIWQLFAPVQCWQKMRWAAFWAIFFTNSSGHPAGSFYMYASLLYLLRKT
jgi:hypothetical protein